MRYGEVTTHERVLDLRTGLLDPAHGVDATQWKLKASGCRPSASCRSPSAPSAAIVYEVEALDPATSTWPSSPTCWPTREPQAQRPGRMTPRAAAELAAPLKAGLGRRARAASGARPPDSPQSPARGRRVWTTSSMACPMRPSCRWRRTGDLARLTVAARLPARGSRLRARQVPGPTAGRASAPRPPCATRWRAPSPRRSWPGGTGCCAEQRELLDQHWGRRPTWRSTARRRAAAGRPGRHVPRPAGRPAGAERQPIPAKGLAGPGYQFGHTFWDTETYVLPVLTYTAPERRPATPCAGGTRTLEMARARAAELGMRRCGVPVADHPRRGGTWRLASGIGGLPHQRRHRRRRHPLPPRHARRGVRPRLRRRAADRRPRGCRHHSGTSTPRHGFRIDGVNRPGRVHRRGRQQRLHQPDGAAEPAGGVPAQDSPPARRSPVGCRSPRRRPRSAGACCVGLHGGALRHPARGAHAVRRGSPTTRSGGSRGRREGPLPRCC